MGSLSSLIKLSIFIALACLGLAIYFILDASNILPAFQDGKIIQEYISATGNFGPFVIVLLMTTAILISPLPSAPIAIAAGTIYGHVWGTVYVIAGSLSGASGAFFIARYLGHEAIQKFAENYLALKFIRSQNKLMGVVFITRLMPFISFDVISYGAGLSDLQYWRFVVATFFGIAPASFLLAHVGSEVASAEIHRIGMAILVVSLFMIVPVIVRKIYLGFAKNQP